MKPAEVSRLPLSWVGEGFGGVVGAEGLLGRAVVAASGLGGEREAISGGRDGGLCGDEVDGSADGVGAVEGGAGAVQDFDAGDGVERDGDVEVEVAGLGVVDAEAVEQEEGLLEGGAADGEVGLDSGGGAGLEVERGVLAEVVDDAVEEEGLGAGVEGLDGAVAFGEGDGLDGGGDGDGLGDGRQAQGVCWRGER